MSDLQSILEKIKALPPEEFAKLDKETKTHPKWGEKALWVPNPGPQTDAYNSKADILLYGGAAAGGKALSIHTIVPTPHGQTILENIKIGDEVFDENLDVCNVTAATEIMFGRNCYNVEFSTCCGNIENIIADRSHQWRIKLSPDENIIKTTGDLFMDIIDDFALKMPKFVDGRFYIKSIKPINSVPVRCIEVDSHSHLYLVSRSMIPTHNSDLGLGLAFNEHRRSLIVRRRYSDIGALVERAVEINGTRNGFNGTPPPILRTVNGKFIQFGANQHIGDEQSFQGRSYDLKIFDEAAHFLESQIHFHLGWLRPDGAHPNQRCRAVLASNPPVDSNGDWLIKMFRPWLDVTHHNPAKSGELRWFVTAGEDTNFEVPSDEVFTDDKGRHHYILQGDDVEAQSRTFIPAKLSDNPFLVDTNYKARLDSLPEPLRSAVRDGNFMLARQDAEWQVIPTQWIIEAQDRWTKDGWRNQGGMSAMAFDPAGGGRDAAELVARYGHWYSEPITKKGDETADGSRAAATIIRYRRDNAPVIVDVGGGYGGSVMLRLDDNGIKGLAYHGAHSSSGKTDDKHLKFANKRAEIWWRFREALDPDQEGGSQICLPPSTELRSDLAAPTYEVGLRGIIVEPKDKLRERLGRSPGKGDVVVMAWAMGELALKRGYNGSRRAVDPRSVGLPQFAKRREGPLRRRRL